MKVCQKQQYNAKVKKKRARQIREMEVEIMWKTKQNEDKKVISLWTIELGRIII